MQGLGTNTVFVALGCLLLFTNLQCLHFYTSDVYKVGNGIN